MPKFPGLAARSIPTSRVGAANRPKNTTPEILLRKLLSSASVRYRLHPQNVLGHPDIVVSWRANIDTSITGVFLDERVAKEHEALDRLHTQGRGSWSRTR